MKRTAGKSLRTRKAMEQAIHLIFLLCGIVAVGFVLCISVYLVISGLPAIREIGLTNFLFGKVWAPTNATTGPQFGILPFILTSVYGTAGALLLGVPVGLMTAIFLAKAAPPRLAAVIRTAVQLLAGIPSVVYGLVGMIVLVPAIRRAFGLGSGACLLAAILVLTVMVLPSIINVAETALQAVPREYEEASLALGATETETYFRVSLPAARSGVAAAVVGLLVGLPALRLKGDYLAIVTLACGEIIKTIINNLSVTGGAKGLDTSAIYADTRTLLPFAIVLIFLVVLVMMNLKNSRHGRAIMAIRDNRIAAESNGVNVTYYKLMVFVLAAFFAGMAGVLYGHTLANIKPAMFDYNMSIEILVIVVLGGMGSIRGSIIATIILRALPEVLRQVADYRMLAYSVLLIVIMLLNSSPQFAEWKGRWSLKALLSLGKTRKEKTKKEAAKK